MKVIRKYSQALLFAVLILIFTGCAQKPKVKGSGNHSSQDQKIANLEKLSPQEQIEVLKKENSRLKSEKPDYMIARLKKEYEESQKTVRDLPELIAEKEKLTKELDDIKEKLKKEGKSPDEMIKSIEEKINETIKDKTPEEILEELRKENKELNLSKWNRPLIGDDIKEKKEELAKLQKKISELSRHLPGIKTIKSENRKLKKILNKLKKQLDAEMKSKENKDSAKKLIKKLDDFK